MMTNYFYRGLIGASVSQFKSKVLKIDLALFKRLRNSEDRYLCYIGLFYLMFDQDMLFLVELET